MLLKEDVQQATVTAEPPQGLACMEIWGGNQRVNREVHLPGLAAWVYSRPFGKAEAGGDLHYFSVCEQDSLSRVALADVGGHGQAASVLAEKLHSLMAKYVSTWDQSNILRELNQYFRQDPAGVEYATVALLGYNRPTGCLAFTNAGHPPPLWYHAAENSWGWLEETVAGIDGGISGLPVGLIPGTEYHQTVVALAPSDLLVLYTDGVTDAEDGSGELLGREALLEWARLLPVSSAAVAGQALLDRLQSFRGSASLDDETIVVLQRL